MNLSNALKAIIENPEDLTALPQLVEQVAQLESDMDVYHQKIVDMRELNRKYLSMIPITGEEPPEPKEEAPVTLQDAREYMIQQYEGE